MKFLKFVIFCLCSSVSLYSYFCFILHLTSSFFLIVLFVPFLPLCKFNFHHFLPFFFRPLIYLFN